ncbi:MAG TPA: radical SAM protein [Planctomycetota bacterium]|nr:radical SAM protein [Planctomycetota bacterium]
MTDRFGRKITYLRISVTDRCNLRCRYCMPAEGVKLLPAEDIFSFEEIVEVTRIAVDMGVMKVRLTGGEPLVRRDIVDLVRALAGIEGINDLAMTTNGTLLAQHARALAAAGLQRVNISLDSTDPQRYCELTRGGNIQHVLDGLDAAQAAGLHPIKLNCVVSDSDCAGDAESVKEFGRSRGLEVRMIRQMNFQAGRFSLIEGSSGGNCPRCNRLRLTSNGQIRPCLFSDMQFGVRKLGALGALRQAVAAKPQAGGPCTHNWMFGIGG